MPTWSDKGEGPGSIIMCDLCTIPASITVCFSCTGNTNMNTCDYVEL